MIIIGHRGAAGLAPENTLDALQSGAEVGSDVLEFDVQATRDKKLLVIHDSTLLRTHRKAHIVRWSSHESIKEATAKGHKIATLEEVLDRFFGKILLNLEIKSRGTGKLVVRLLEEKYIMRSEDWQNILLSSFKPAELKVVRKLAPEAELALLHARNPFAFVLHNRQLDLTAVGFNRLYINSLALEVAKQLGLFPYTYTVNRPEAARKLHERGIDGIVTDNPKVMRAKLDDIL